MDEWNALFAFLICVQFVYEKSEIMYVGRNRCDNNYNGIEIDYLYT
jgi:hypothetical protein